MKISIKVKASAFLAILLLAAVGFFSVLVLNGIRDNQKQQYEDYLVQQSEIASNYLKQTYLMDTIKDPGEFFKARSQELVKRFELMSGMHAALYDMSGRQLADSRPAEGETDIKSLLEYALKGKYSYFEEGNTVVFVSPLYNSGGQLGAIRFSYPTEKNNLFYTNIKYLLLYVGIFVFVICFVCAYLYVYPMAQGIMKLRNAARRIEEGDYTDAVQLRRNDELGELSRGIYFMGFKIKRNIDEMKGEQNKLQLAVQKLELLRKQQKQFIGNVTHEFKTPLTVIKAYTDLVGMYPEDASLVGEAKENIERETLRLSDMVEKSLQLSALEKYDFELKKEPVDIYEVLDEICENMRGKVQRFGLRLHAELEHQTIIADREGLMQIFINLLDNAIKYNRPDGEIWVACSRKEDWLSITVKDTGIGIPKDERDRIFEPFYTVSRNRSNQPGSTGLGLALVKELVEKQGAEIDILDIQAEGTAFEVRFPTY